MPNPPRPLYNAMSPSVERTFVNCNDAPNLQWVFGWERKHQECTGFSIRPDSELFHYPVSGEIISITG